MTRTITQSPNNAYTSQTAEVYTASGFNAGDIVYYQNGDYKSPAVTPSAFVPASSLSFQASITGPVPTNYMGGNPAISPIFSYSGVGAGLYYGGSTNQGSAPLIAAYQSSSGTSGQSTITVSSNTGIAVGQFVTGAGIGAGATVTNISGTTITLSVPNTANLSSTNVTFYSGNIVHVWVAPISISGGQTVSQAYFTIVSSAGAQVVAPTSLSATYLTASNSNITVTPLTGGGFAYVFVNSSGGTANKPCWGIVSNTGTIVQAMVNDTTYTQTTAASYTPAIAALPNGGFVMVVKNGSALAYFKIVTATGTVTQAWTSTGFTSTITAASKVGLAVRSTGDILIFDFYSAAPSYQYAVFSSSGSVIVSPQTFSSSYISSYTQNQISATCLVDGTTFVIAYTGILNSFPVVITRQLPSGNTLGSEVSLIPNSNIQGGGSSPAFVTISSLSSGGYVVAFTDTMQAIQYAFFNASGTAVSGTNASGAVPINLGGGTFIQSLTQIAIIETPTTVNMYWNNQNQNTRAYNQFYTQINKTTYLPVYPSSSNYLTATISTTSPSVVNLSNSTATGLKYNLVSQETDTYSVALPTTLSPITVSSTASYSISMCTLTTGNVCVAYANASGVFVAIYSSTGSLQRTISIGTAASSGAYWRNNFQVVAMAAGKFAILWPDSTNTQYIAIYSSSFTQVAKLNVSTLNNAGLSDAYNLSIASTAGDNLVLGVSSTTSSAVGAYIYSNNLTLLSSIPTIDNGGSGNYTYVSGNDYGGFSVIAYEAYIPAWRFYTYIQTGATTWTNVAYRQSFAYSTTGSLPGNANITYLGSGVWGALQPNASGSTNVYYSLFNDVNQLTYTSATTFTAYNPNTPSGGYGIGQNAFGLPVVITDNNASNNLALYVGSSAKFTTAAGGGSFGTYPGTLKVVPISTSTNSANYSVLPQISPAGGYGVAISWLNANQYPVLQFIQSYPFTSSYTIPTSQVNTDSPVTISPASGTSTTQILGTSIAGVAATTASAGSTGQLVINGLAQLNSNYSTTNVQSFDYTGLAIDGVRGTINGRTVNLQGNS